MHSSWNSSGLWLLIQDYRCPRSTLDLCGSLLVFKHTEGQDNAHIYTHTMSLKLH